jgi:hypothetical protein
MTTQLKKSEQAGMYSILLFTHNICSFYNIKEDSVTLACNGLLALNTALSEKYPSVDAPCFELLGAIFTLRHCSVISREVLHVPGHQDMHNPDHQLTEWEELNIAMYAAAKEDIEVAQQAPCHFDIQYEPWSLWLGNCKLTGNLPHWLYQHEHSQVAALYWTKKHAITANTWEIINWDAIHKARKSSSLSMNHFITKHSVGMCGVGKFLVHWKETDDPSCPRCGNFKDSTHVFKDSTHVWLCKDPEVQELWKTSVE